VSAVIHDPVSKVRLAFEPRGEDLIVDVWLEPGGGLPPHLHPRQTERWSVVEGSAEFTVGDEKRLIGPEDGEIVVAPGTKHALASVTAGEAHLRCVAEPALRLQEFLEESAAAAREGLFTQRGLPRGLRGARWAARFIRKYGDETVFLSPPPAAQKLLVALLARGA
jgi:mannose-6-phosphate isomerase-like protein (cupin superfamily)